jgi:hypothetical protein
MLFCLFFVFAHDARDSVELAIPPSLLGFFLLVLLFLLAGFPLFPLGLSELTISNHSFVDEFFGTVQVRNGVFALFLLPVV